MSSLYAASQQGESNVVGRSLSLAIGKPLVQAGAISSGYQDVPRTLPDPGFVSLGDDEDVFGGTPSSSTFKFGSMSSSTNDWDLGTPETEDEANQAAEHDSYKNEFIVPKLEVIEDDAGTDGLENIPPSADSTTKSCTSKRPRGRPRIHPVQRDEASTKGSRMARTKTGCSTCRLRKKKCDETKPECMFVP